MRCRWPSAWRRLLARPSSPTSFPLDTPPGSIRSSPFASSDQQSESMFLQELLDIEHPIIQAPMAGVQGSALAVAVSNAGGLGSLPCAMLDVDSLRRELASIRAQSARPFNVNFFCHQQPKPNAERESR